MERFWGRPTQLLQSIHRMHTDLPPSLHSCKLHFEMELPQQFTRTVLHSRYYLILTTLLRESGSKHQVVMVLSHSTIPLVREKK